jgi:hypothetical protein
MGMTDRHDGNQSWCERLRVAGELSVFAASIALIMIVVITSLHLLADECQRSGHLPAFFSCFRAQ